MEGMEFLNVLIQQFEFFWVLALNRKSHIHADLFNSYFYLLFCRPMNNFGHYQEDSVSHSMLITTFLSFFVSEVTETWDGFHTSAEWLRHIIRQWDCMLYMLVTQMEGIGIIDYMWRVIPYRSHCIVGSSYEIKQTVIITTRISSNTNFMCQFQVSF